MQDAMSISKMFKGHGSIFTSIISLELFDEIGKEIFNQVFKFSEA
jgi:hypothetical protein